MIALLSLLQQAPGELRGQAEIFNEIFFVFLSIGTLVGIVVVLYTLYHVYKYRDTESRDSEEIKNPLELGELPTGQTGGKSKKMFVSFGISAIIVISLVVYAYGLLLYVEAGPAAAEVDDNVDNMDIEVVAYQFGWQFEYPNGHVEQNTLRVPQGDDQVIRLKVTSRDVWHNLGVPELRVKADAIPGEYQTTWFTPEETGTYTVECFELCGLGHSDMKGEIIVMNQDDFDEWYEGTAEDDNGGES